MNLFSDIRDLVLASLTEMAASGQLPAGLDFSAVAVEPPRDAAHGDMATNAAMVLAKPAGMQPRAIADALASRLMADPRMQEPPKDIPFDMKRMVAPAATVMSTPSSRIMPLCGS